MAEAIEKLSLDMLVSASEKYENINELTLELEINGEVKTAIVELYKYFSPMQVKDCVKEFIQKFDIIRKKDKDGFGDITEPYLMFLIIKHFTTMEFPDDLQSQLKYIERMLNTGIMFKIFTAFDDKEIVKIREQIEFVLENFGKNEEIMKELKQSMKGKLENPSLILE